MPATDIHPNSLGTVHQQSDVAEAETWIDATEQFAEHCAQTVTKLLGESSLYFEQPAFATPQIQLTKFVERLLRQTHTPLSIAVATLTVINWITEHGLCPLASSSPHHLFMGTYRAVLHSALDMRDVDAEWVKFAGDLVPLAEVTQMREEVDMMLQTLSERRWAVLSDLVSEDVHNTVNVLYNAELLQANEQQREAEEFLLMEEESVRSGFLVYERDPSSDSPKYDSDDSDDWSDGKDYVSRRDQNLSWADAFDELPRESKG
ncbi:hypothetical protein PC9H_001873 [Pleurotus ostreatus]|uniref:Uncharacterized protein n=1 Tax=Pleurotus ostreatus TaxID=5322 RepID=A0A8H7DPX2_PLEOS|nr:uncharacterized protein PC9H_001873 [Pleurotus ostreatus]KAF7419286.1 hypothetical protein PC9H_001873 [Pleurotus ostreatus]